MSVTTPWPAIGAALESDYSNRMFVHQPFLNDKFWEAFLPQETEYFGTKVLNIFIAQKPYGWIDTGGGAMAFAWPPDGMVAAFAARPIDKFVSYKTVVYVDMKIAEDIRVDCPESDMNMMMDQTATALEAFCNATEGWEWGGRITTAVSPSYFTAVIDDFYNPGGITPSYLRHS